MTPAGWGVVARIVLVAAAVVSVVLVARGLYQWAYDNGVQAERLAHTQAQQRADQQSRGAEQSATTASESIGDQSRAEAAAEAAAISQETGESLSRIEYVYLNTPAAALPCTADGRPAPLPDGVLLELDQAVEAFNGAAATAR